MRVLAVSPEEMKSFDILSLQTVRDSLPRIEVDTVLQIKEVHFHVKERTNKQ